LNKRLLDGIKRVSGKVETGENFFSEDKKDLMVFTSPQVMVEQVL
jgi:hypothetical protein